MRLLIINIAAALLRLVLSLRYRLRVTGLEKLDARGGYLILPNHPAEVDPLLVTTQLWRRFYVRPVVLEKYYYLPVAHCILKTIRAVPMPDMEAGSGARKRARVERAVQESAAALRAGDNLLIYPSGRLMTGNLERVGGNSGVHTLLNAGDAKVLLVRTRGLYGSIFSRALSGAQSPDFWPTVGRAVKVLLNNLVFFAPRRDVSIEFCPAPEDFPRDGDVVTLNRWLSEWFNRPGPDGPTLVPYAFWSRAVPALPAPLQRKVELSEVPPEIVAKVTAKVAALAHQPPERIKPEHRLGEDLGLDSLNVAELLVWLSDRYDVLDMDLAEMTTVAALLVAAAGRQAHAEHEAPIETPAAWEEQPGRRPVPAFHNASSIPAAFLKCCDHMGCAPALADDQSGVLTWKRLKIAALLMAGEMQKLPGDRIGILLPASVAATLGALSAMLAGKTPVMLNWTVGRRNLEHAVEAAGLQAIVTSEAFLDKVEADLSFLEERFVMLEQVRRRFNRRRKLAAALQARRRADALVKAWRLDQTNENDPAVILFTSGSEAAPKGVPLSHKNILSDLEGGQQVLDFRPDDVILGFLPPFHSFGLTVTTILPLISGIKLAYYPNPNESRRLATACAKWQVTMLAGTPAFLKGILSAGAPEHFARIRLMMAGADRAPEELFEMVRRANADAQCIEGYGITECSPIVTVNRLGQPRAGVGQPLDGVELLIVNEETLKPLPDGERGLILIRGDNVFSGYLGGKPDPFVEAAGKRWYNSGDLGYLKEGALYLAGRLKRFIKIGGEMISLPAIEEALSQRWPAGDKGPVLAVTALDKNDGSRPRICLFAAVTIDLEEANQRLKAAGLASLSRITEVLAIPEIPLLGTGKPDLQKLNVILRSREEQ